MENEPTVFWWGVKIGGAEGWREVIDKIEVNNSSIRIPFRSGMRGGKRMRLKRIFHNKKEAM